MLDHYFFLAENLNEFVVSWLTMDNPLDKPQVSFGIATDEKDFMAHSSDATITEFTDEGQLKLKRYVYRAKLSGLKPNTLYCKFFFN